MVKVTKKTVVEKHNWLDLEKITHRNDDQIQKQMQVVVDKLRENIQHQNLQWLKVRGNQTEGTSVTEASIMPIEESEQYVIKTYDSDTGNHDYQEERTAYEYRGKLEELNVAKQINNEGSADEEVEKDPLFMNIDKIAQLPMASKKPTKILAAETLTTMASSTHADPQI